jgi:hypothetical protein
MVRNTVTSGDKTYSLWIRVDTKKAFPDKILTTVQKVARSKSGKRHVKKISETRLICSPALYEKIQSQVDILNSCEVSLFVEIGGGKTKALVKDAKNYGVVKDDYDKLLRYIYN